MSELKSIQVTAMPRTSLLEDGTRIDMEFKGDGGERIVLRFDPDRLSSFVSRVLQVTHEARTRKQAKSGHLEVRPLAAVGTAAQAAVGGEAVIVGMRTDNGQLYSFSISIADAEELQAQLADAAAEAWKQAKQTRQ